MDRMVGASARKRSGNAGVCLALGSRWFGSGGRAGLTRLIKALAFTGSFSFFAMLFAHRFLGAVHHQHYHADDDANQDKQSRSSGHDGSRKRSL